MLRAYKTFYTLLQPHPRNQYNLGPNLIYLFAFDVIFRVYPDLSVLYEYVFDWDTTKRTQPRIEIRASNWPIAGFMSL